MRGEETGEVRAEPRGAMRVDAKKRDRKAEEAIVAGIVMRNCTSKAGTKVELKGIEGRMEKKLFPPKPKRQARHRKQQSRLDYWTVDMDLKATVEELNLHMTNVSEAFSRLAHIPTIK